MSIDVRLVVIKKTKNGKLQLHELLLAIIIFIMEACPINKGQTVPII